MKAPSKPVVLATLAAVAIGGYLLVSRLPALVRDYQQARQLDPAWGYVYLGGLGAAAGAAVVLVSWVGWGLWQAGVAKRQRRTSESRNPSQMSAAERSAETDAHLTDVAKLADDHSLPAAMREPLKASLAEIEQKRSGQKLEIVAFGTVSSGKSSLLNLLAGREVFRTDVQAGTTTTRSEVPWTGKDRVVLVDTPGLAEAQGHEREALARLAARDADLVLFVVDGPLKDFEHAVLADLARMEKRILLCLNKADWFAPADRQRLIDQLVEQTSGLVDPADVISLRSRATARLRVRVLPDGQEMEESIEEQPDIRALAERILSIVERDGRDLLAANLLLQARGLAADARQRIRAALDSRADEVVERAMWQAAAAAALSPLPMLDLAAGLAVTTNMVVSLARVYQQPIDLDTVSRLLGELGKNLVAILGTSAASPMIGAAVASLLKTVPGVGTLAGGALQGLVQALVTRWIGRVFIEYFRGEMQQPPSGWAALARSQWNEVTRPAELAQLVRAGLARWGDKQP